jgi:Flp pilus assembly protein TadD
LAATLFVVPAAAQTGSNDVRSQFPPGAVVQPLGEDNGAELRRYMTQIARDPHDLEALLGAGREAVRMGDPVAADSFLARAQEIAPRDPRIKSALGTALIQAEQPRNALDMFAQAIALGASAEEIASDRGLAYDMLGDPRRAQQDYALAMRSHDTPELRRRMALSLAITGQRDAALRLIDTQLRQNDRAAWRTQAFILALTGDPSGAEDTARRVMPAGTAAPMAPFFARLAGLSASQKAMAVHFGEFPAQGTQMAQAQQEEVSADPGALALAEGSAPAHAGTRTTTPERARAQGVRVAAARPASTPAPQQRSTPSADSRGMPSLTTAMSLRSAPLPPPEQVAREPDRRSAPGGEQIAAAEAVRSPVVSASERQSPPQRYGPSDPASIGGPAPSTPLRRFQPDAEAAPPSGSPIVQTDIAPSSLARRDEPPQPGFSQPTQSAQPESPPAPRRDEFAEVARFVNSLPRETLADGPPAQPGTQRSRQPFSPPESTRIAQQRAQARQSAARPHVPANPSRHWVQIATGANRSALPREFARLRLLAPDQLGRRAAYSVPLRATNRLLVGPFESDDDAQAFVNALARHNINAVAWTSAAGEEIERLQTGR